MKCPICGEEDALTISFLYQFSKDYKITKKGCLSKKYTIDNNHSMETSVLVCKNGCDVNDLDWDWDYKTRKLTISEEKRWAWR